MEMTVLTDIAYKADVPQLFRRLRVEAESEDAKTIEGFARSAEAIARPKAM
jgi:hypothetical protein